MEKLVSVKKEYASLDQIEAFLKKETSFGVKQDYDVWDMRTDANGQMEKCVVIKKSTMHGAKLFFVNENTIKVNHIIPNKMMNAYFGKNQQKYQSIIEIITGKIKDMFMSGGQKKALEEMIRCFDKIAV